MIAHRFAIAALLLAGLFATAHGVRAAESYDNCSGFIDTLPATISTQGVWCLRHDLATAITSGAAITIATNNVTIDCNDFKIGGLAAGPASTASGIYASNRQNATVRHCNVRGFYNGISLNLGAGNLVEDNRLDNNLSYGIYVNGAHNLVQRNRVFDTGGFSSSPSSFGISAHADIVDNIVDGVFTDGTTSKATGIRAYSHQSVVKGNRVGGVVLNGIGGEAIGIDVWDSGVTVADNQVSASLAATNGKGIYGYTNKTFCSGNTSANFQVAWLDCILVGGNASY